MSENDGVEYVNEFYEWNKRSIKVTSIIIVIAFGFLGFPSLWLKENLIRSIMESVFWLFIGISAAFLIYTISNSLIPKFVRVSSTEIVFIYSFNRLIIKWSEIEDIKIKKGNRDILLSNSWGILRIFLRNGKRCLFPIYLSGRLSKIILDEFKRSHEEI